jgi:hypothetical protein
MGIVGVKPRQLAPTVGMMGSGSMDLSAPSPTIANLLATTRIDGSSPATAVDSASPTAIDIDIASSAINIDIALFTIDIDITPPIIANAIASINIDTAPPTTPVFTIDSPATTTVDPISSLTGMTSARIGGFDMAFGLFNFHVDGDGTTELISISELTPLVADSSAPPATGGTPSTTTPPTPSEEDPRLETSTPSVGSNDFQDPPPSPTTAYCIDCDAYHFVGAEDFSSHEIAGYEDPRGGTTAIYPTISECEQALNALMLQHTLYDLDYVKGL